MYMYSVFCLRSGTISFIRKVKYTDKYLYLWYSYIIQGSQIRQIWRISHQNCSDDSTEVTEGVTSTPEIFGNKQWATSTPEIFGNSFALTFFATKYNLR